jgi:hypothetical protein
MKFLMIDLFTARHDAKLNLWCAVSKRFIHLVDTCDRTDETKS